MEIGPAGEVIIRARGLKAVGVVLLAAVVTAVMIWMLMAETSPAPRYPLWVIHGVGAFGTVFFGGATLFGLSRTIGRRPALVIDRDGIVDHAGWEGVGRVRWSEIAGARLVVLRNVKILAFDLHDPAPFMARGNALQRLLRSTKSARTGTPVSIATGGLDIGLEELAAAVRRFFDQANQGRVSRSA